MMDSGRVLLCSALRLNANNLQGTLPRNLARLVDLTCEPGLTCAEGVQMRDAFVPAPAGSWTCQTTRCPARSHPRLGISIP